MSRSRALAAGFAMGDEEGEEEKKKKRNLLNDDGKWKKSPGNGQENAPAHSAAPGARKERNVRIIEGITKSAMEVHWQ
uniref:Uncharacterized protein n=1 Tax=Oryza rufipogon TaxID=4529 RepID=A0A0E0NCV7_ORYRU